MNSDKEIREAMLDAMAGNRRPWFGHDDSATLKGFRIHTGSDGCSWSPDGFWWDSHRWLEACLMHDYEYFLLREFWTVIQCAGAKQQDALLAIWKQRRKEADKNLRVNIRYCSRWRVEDDDEGESVFRLRPWRQRCSGFWVGLVYSRCVRRVGGPAARPGEA